jgi:chromosome segregation ATPase
MTPDLNPAIDAIKQQLEPLTDEINELQILLSVKKKAMAQLEAALKPLIGKNTKARKSSKPYATKETVMEACLSIVEENAPILKADLELLVKDKISKGMGFSLSGVQLRLRECLASTYLSIAPDGLVTKPIQPVDESRGNNHS